MACLADTAIVIGFIVILFFIMETISEEKQ